MGTEASGHRGSLEAPCPSLSSAGRGGRVCGCRWLCLLWVCVQAVSLGVCLWVVSAQCAECTGGGGGEEALFS